MMNSSELAAFINSRVIIKAAELDLILSAEQYFVIASGKAEMILEQANRQAQRLGAEAEHTADRVKAEAHKCGYQQGLQQAREELAETAQRAQAALSRSWHLQDDKISFLVLRLLGKILAESDAEPHFFDSVAKRVLRATRDQRLLVFTVSTDQLQVARSRIARAVEANGAPQFIEVRADPDLPVGACLIKTEYAEINASLDAQLDVLQRVLAELFGEVQQSADRRRQSTCETGVP